MVEIHLLTHNRNIIIDDLLKSLLKVIIILGIKPTLYGLIHQLSIIFHMGDQNSFCETFGFNGTIDSTFIVTNK